MTNVVSTNLAAYGFQSVGRRLVHKFRDPDLSAYMRQKSLEMVSAGGEGWATLERYDWLDSPLGTSDVPRYLVRSWDHFYSRRVSAALEYSGEFPRVMSLFPGHTVLAPIGKSSSFRYRGSLAYEQFLDLFQYTKGAPSSTGFENFLKKQVVDEDPYWPWKDVAIPRLQFVTADYDAMSDVGDPVLQAQAQRSFLERLYADCAATIGGANPELACLKLVHRAWTDTALPVYSKFAIAVVSRVMNQARGRLNQDNLLPFLFELESFASYVTYLSRIAPVASGWYSSSWLDVGYLPLTQIRATELCVRQRLIEEVINIPQRGFAPVIVNEFDSVADGNHRVTSTWIFNILKHAMHTEWSLDNEDFQARVREYVEAHREALGMVSLYESLKQLASFLGDRHDRTRLNGLLKPALKRVGAIRKLPVVMLPEYSMGTVEKEIYDNHGQMMRVPPSLYAEIAQSSDMVLPARASYHFTDAVPMPWFEVVRHAGFSDSEDNGAQSESPRRNHSLSRKLLLLS
ncbi:MAG: hypothetical protein K2X93_14035 [Candidatus Obscuribacterales bacterium]|nr:hypothetical protein [Candidatus Obscuribacterales bacterium]